MYEILLLSKNKEIADIVNNILRLPDFILHVFSFSESSTIKTEEARVIIIDVCDSEIKTDTFYKDLINRMVGFKKPILVILDLKQAESVLEVLNAWEMIEDIVFKKQLIKELKTRVSFILAKICDAEVPDSSISIAGLVLNTEKFELLVDGRPVELTFKEYELLKFLIENKNRVFRRNKLLSVIWGYDYYGGSRTVDVHMRRLRTKLGAPYSEMLKTVRNVGYMFSR